MSSYTPITRAPSNLDLASLESSLIARSRSRSSHPPQSSPALHTHGEARSESEAPPTTSVAGGGGSAPPSRRSSNSASMHNKPKPFSFLTLAQPTSASTASGIASVPPSRRGSPSPAHRVPLPPFHRSNTTPRRGSTQPPTSAGARAGELLTGNASLFYMAGLTDDKGGSYEKYRLSPEEIKSFSGRKRKGLRAFYERQNEILDGFAEVDRIIDSTHSLTSAFYTTAVQAPDLYEITPVLPAHQKTRSSGGSAANGVPSLAGTSALTSEGRTDRRPKLRRRRSRESSDWSGSEDRVSVAERPEDREREDGEGDAEGEGDKGTENGITKANGHTVKFCDEPTRISASPPDLSSYLKSQPQPQSGAQQASQSQPLLGGGADKTSYGATDLERQGDAAVEEEEDDAAEDGKGEEEGEFSTAVKVAIWVNLGVNVALLLGKVLAAVLSNSISVIASLVDSAMDLLSTLIIVGTTRVIENKNWRMQYMFPVGKRRMEPMGVVIFSVFMISSFVQVLVESVQRLASNEPPVEVPVIGLGIMSVTIAIKIVMWAWCRNVKSTAVQALVQDAENDVVFNAGSIFFPFIGQLTKQGWLDPMGGIVLSLYIIVEWVQTLYTNVSNLTGRRAAPQEHTRIVYLITRFSPIIQAIQHVEVYHMGDQFIVEVDIVLPAETSLPLAHNVGESVQYALECLEGVERAYVHVDFSSKNPSSHVKR